MKRDDEIACSFCGRPRRLALFLVTGPRGKNICDLCVLEARSRPAPPETGPWGACCSFCGKSSEEVKLMLLAEESAICADCVVNSRKIIERVLGESEILSEAPKIDADNLKLELTGLVHEFEKSFNQFQINFMADEIDWNAHNQLALAMLPIKSKAGLMGLGDVSELMWEIETAFKAIRFDDIAGNKSSVERLSALVAQLLEAVASK